MNRFDRQINLRGFGTEGLAKLQKASVLVIGAGGLGCPALQYLAAVGIGTIGIMDGDTISLSNLNRQILYGESDIGQKKAIVAGNNLLNKYSDIKIDIITDYLNTNNALGVISSYDIIIDCTDNFTVRYMANDACALLNKPLVYGAIYEYEGQISLFHAENDKGLSFNYRDLFPHPPDLDEIPNCSETGVIGVLPGIIGTIQAAEAIKYLLGLGNLLVGRILYFNMEQMFFYEVDIHSQQELTAYRPKSGAEFRAFDYSLSCAAVPVIDWNSAYEIFTLNPDKSIFVDIREADEVPHVNHVKCVEYPLSEFDEEIISFDDYSNLFVFCQHGIRSVRAVSLLKRKYTEKKIYSIKGGVMEGNSPIFKTTKNHA